MKTMYIIMLALGIVLVLQVAGFMTGANAVLQIVGITFDENNQIVQSQITISSVMNVLFDLSNGLLIVIGAGLGGAVVAGLFTKARLENLILLPFITGTLALFVQTFVGVIKITIATGSAWAIPLVTIIFAPIAIGLIISLADYFRGTDG